MYSQASELLSFIDKLPIAKRKRGRQKNSRKYLDVVCAFDIETSNVPEIEQSFMYIWQLQVGDATVTGRYWSEFLDLLENISKRLAQNLYMVIYVHNLSFEFQFLRGVYSFGEDEVFAMDNRDVLKCEMFSHFEFRCSYHLTNMPLRNFLLQMKVPDEKTELDYSKIRYPWTPLDEKEMEYCVNDVKGLVEALERKMKMDGDTLYTIPMTSTGYVRRDVKRAMQGWNHNELRELLPDYDVYLLLREAFRGGNTHASRWYSTEIIEDVHSYDRVSSYPDVMINKKFPMKPWVWEKYIDLDRLTDLVKRGRPFIMRVVLTNLRLRDEYEGCPYLSSDKCRYTKDGYFDNGRVLSAEFLETTVTDIDWSIICEQYLFDELIIKVCYSSGYGYLPEPIRESIRKYYAKKTELKGAESEDDQYFYARYKEMVNACYGMMVQDPLRESVLFNDEEGFIEEEMNPREQYEKQMKKAFLSYAWGVWTSAWARWELNEMMKIVKNQGGEFVYCDTDSVKYFGDVDFTEYNREHEKESAVNRGVAVDKHGRSHPLGVLELDGTYKRFKTMGAKKYAYEDDTGLHITIAGVNKKKGARELERNGGLEAMEEGFIFREAGGTESKYNDQPYGIWHSPEGDVDITSNLYITESEYTLGLTAEYMWLLEYCQKLKYSEIALAGIYEKKL